MSELIPPRDPKALLREMSARIKIKDIKSLYKLKDRISVKWYESGLVALLFGTSLAFLFIVLKLIPEPKPLVREFVVGASIALILTVTAILEFLLRKFNALRRLYEIHTRILEQLDKDLSALRRELHGLTEEEDESNGEEARSPAGSDDPAD